MDERRQPVEEKGHLTTERLNRIVLRSPGLKHVLNNSRARPSPSRTLPGASTLTTVPIVSLNTGSRCEICRSLTPEKLEVEFGHLTRPVATGVLHHNFEDMKTSAGHGCDLCQILVWAIHYSTSSQEQHAKPDTEKFNSSKARFYLRLTKAYVNSRNNVTFPPSLVLCAPTTNLSKQSFKWTTAGKVSVTREPENTEAVPIACHPDSKEVYKLVETWLENCTNNHTMCKAISQKVKSDIFPKRLIDTGDVSSAERLCVVIAEPGQVYAALSYAWGFISHRMLLTKANMDALSQDIQLSAMPQTFQDAVLVCRKFGVRYLWIDALCIVQSDPEDAMPNEELQQQIALMSSIYANAIFTIAAASAAGVHEGLFGSEKRFPTSLEPHAVYTCYTDQQRYAIPPEPKWQRAVLNGPLQQRAWALQERALSRRILHYTHWAVFWECNELKANEFRPMDILSGYPLYDPKFKRLFSGCYVGLPITSQTPLSMDKKSELLVKVWGTVVQDYTRRHLTSETDLLPAISAIAGQFQQMTGDIYSAGLWQSVLWLNLMWHTIRHYRELPRRPAKYTAPSWSWASVVGPITMCVPDDPSEPTLTIISVSAIPLSLSNLYGQITSGFLRVQGYLRKDFRAKRRRINALVEHYIQKPPQTFPRDMVIDGIAVKFNVPLLNRPESKVYFDVPSDEELGFCILQLCGQMRSGFKRNGLPFFYGMVIVPTHVDDEYRRIGLVEICDEDFFEEPEATITTLSIV